MSQEKLGWLITGIFLITIIIGLLFPNACGSENCYTSAGFLTIEVITIILLLAMIIYYINKNKEKRI